MTEPPKKNKPCLDCGEPCWTAYCDECLTRQIRENFEEIKLLEAKKAKLEKELGLWPYGRQQ